jgi:hypothetical protein
VEPPACRGAAARLTGIVKSGLSMKDPLAVRCGRQKRPNLLRYDRRYRLDDSEMKVSVSEVTWVLNEARGMAREAGQMSALGGLSKAQRELQALLAP